MTEQIIGLILISISMFWLGYKIAKRSTADLIVELVKAYEQAQDILARAQVQMKKDEHEIEFLRKKVFHNTPDSVMGVFDGSQESLAEIVRLVQLEKNEQNNTKND